MLKYFCNFSVIFHLTLTLNLCPSFLIKHSESVPLFSTWAATPGQVVPSDSHLFTPSSNLWFRKMKPMLKCLKPAFFLLTCRWRLHWQKEVFLYESLWENEPSSHLIYGLSLLQRRIQMQLANQASQLLLVLAASSVSPSLPNMVTSGSKNKMATA